MRRMGWVGSVLWLVGFVGCSSGERAPRIDFASEVVDLGVIDPGSNPFLISFKNSGRATLRVNGVESSCSCTRADCTPEVAPGAGGELKGHVSVQRGPGNAQLSLKTNETGPPKVVRLRWFGKTPPALLPDLLEFRTRVGEAAVQPFEISYPAGDTPWPLKFLGVEGLPAGAVVTAVSDDPRAITSIPGLQASMTVAPSPFVGLARFRLSLPAAKVSGVVASSCLVKVELAGKAFDLPLELIARADEGFRVSPESLMFIAIDLDSIKKIRRKAIIVTRDAADPIRVVEKPSFLDVELSKAEGNPAITHLSARVTQAPDARGAEHRIVLEDPAGKRVSVAILIGLGR